ncbi:CoA-transferase [Capillimicrobium parvum]|uniref:3-oxoadipate CoA-transferase subunit B n=1 Tax=Capillimicrobium parvum TaxID=2884022 RepID=A0A9E7BZ24_9ACTN|nr:CoA-transferase [Capillimicrobium parvum]UGS34861.1 3-oxoadipate CoA-transferase subunit B [Capillimicrobium parvum]
MTEYRIEELMVCRIASEVDDSGVTVLGSFTPLAYASYMLAKLTHARDAYLVGFNAIGMPPVELNLTGTEAAAYRGALARWSFLTTTQTVHLGKRGLVECVSPAQIDGTGAFNLACIGDYAHPKVRMPGGAGSPEVVQHYERILVYFGRHDRRTLVEQVSFRTGQRAPLSAEERRRRGLLAGPVRIITPLAVLIKDDDERPFRIESLNPGVAAEQVVENTGFELEVPADIPTTAEPTADQVALLRERIDPHGTTRFDFLDAQERKQMLRDLLQDEWDRALAASRVAAR